MTSLTLKAISLQLCHHGLPILAFCALDKLYQYEIPGSAQQRERTPRIVVGGLVTLDRGRGKMEFRTMHVVGKTNWIP